MMGRWDECIAYEGTEAEQFLVSLFSEPKRKLLLVAAAGFDRRSSYLARLLAGVAAGRVSAVFIREQRPEPTVENLARADENERDLRELFPDARFVSIEIFAERDSAVIVGSQVVRQVRQVGLDEVTDVILDVSALSIGLSFPLVKFYVEGVTHVQGRTTPLNVHAVLIADGELDEHVEREFIDKVTTVQGFAGQLGLSARRDRIARLWVPQLSRRKQVATRLIHQHLVERAPLLDVCPLIPYPSQDPRLGDKLAIEYIDELEGPWLVDERSLMAVSEGDPLDVYRVLLRLDDTRREVFHAIGESEIVLSPIGPKSMAFGCLLAAIERSMPVVYVETLRYGEAMPAVSVSSSQVRYFWLCGEAYESS